MSLIGLLITVLIAVLVLCVVVWAVQRLTAAFSVPDPLSGFVLVAVVIIVLLWFLWFLNRSGVIPSSIRF